VSEISDQLAAEALKAASVSNDGVNVSRRSLRELMDYENHLANKAAAADMASTVKSMFSVFVPPGGH
jgi:phosphopantetheine adenylyltransferase